MRNFVYHNHYLQSDIHHTLKRSGFSITFAYSYVKNRCPLFETKTARRGGFRVLCAPEALRPIRS
jgi:hypothetical protein